MAAGFQIHRAGPDAATIEALTDVLMDCVEGGASVGFMLPLSRARALGFWQDVLESTARGERIVLVAEDGVTRRIVGTVQVVLSMPGNARGTYPVTRSGRRVGCAARRCSIAL